MQQYRFTENGTDIIRSSVREMIETDKKTKALHTGMEEERSGENPKPTIRMENLKYGDGSRKTSLVQEQPNGKAVEVCIKTVDDRVLNKLFPELHDLVTRLDVASEESSVKDMGMFDLLRQTVMESYRATRDAETRNLTSSGYRSSISMIGIMEGYGRMEVKISSDSIALTRKDGENSDSHQFIFEPGEKYRISDLMKAAKDILYNPQQFLRLANSVFSKASSVLVPGQEIRLDQPKWADGRENESMAIPFENRRGEKEYILLIKDGKGNNYAFAEKKVNGKTRKIPMWPAIDNDARNIDNIGIPKKIIDKISEKNRDFAAGTISYGDPRYPGISKNVTKAIEHAKNPPFERDR